MVGASALEEFVHIVVLALPVAVLFLLLVLIKRGRKRRTPQPADQPAPGPQPEQVAVTSAAEAARPHVAATAAAARPVEAVADLPTLNGRIQAALESGALPALAPLYLEVARRQAAQGDEAARLTALRSAAGYGALHGPKLAHAQARMELAEAAYAGGDLTSACEQWQIARTAFQEAGQADAHARAERRMRENGCPTDWVLTDF